MNFVHSCVWELFFILYIKLPRLSVCVSVFRISQKRADRFPWNFSWFIGVIGRRERIKKENFDPPVCKIWGNGAKWPILRKSPRATSAGLCNGLRSEFARSHARWPKVRLQHGPVARWPGGVSSSLRWGTVSNAFCAPESSLVCSVVRLPGRSRTYYRRLYIA